MRPLPGDDAFGRQRSADHEPGSSGTPVAHSQMSFFLANEATVDSYLDQPSIAGSRMRNSGKVAELGHVFSGRNGDKSTTSLRSASRESEMESEYAYSPLSIASLPSPAPMPGSSQNHAPLSRPITPITIGTSVTGSLMSNPSSRRNSLAGSVSENAVELDEAGRAVESATIDMGDSGGVPQLVMPSIKMPCRRPFTDTGKKLGRLKVQIVGKAGVGKTSLVKAIVQTCEHIVHVDPITPPARSRTSDKAAARSAASRKRSSGSTETIYEISASTKSYPEWWSELDEPRANQRRKSLGDQVLERNICFIDTPGYGNGSSALGTIAACVEYVESHLDKVSSDALSESEMLNLLGGNGGVQVDVVLYMVHHSLSSVDVEYLKRLTPLTNVIPLLAQADVLSPEEQSACKEQIALQLREADIHYFDFTTLALRPATSVVATIPYAVSSATGSDHDVMDASLLMSPDYVQPLVSSELAFLVKHLFSTDGASWLRYSAAKKYLQWREASLPLARPKHLYRPLSVPNATTILDSAAGALISRPPLSMARICQQYNTSSAPRLQVADWAADLQRSLASEKAQLEALARGERAVWLTERLNQCVPEGTLVPTSHPKGACRAPKNRRRGPYSKTTSRHQDPLALLQLAADLKAKSWFAFEVLGSIGILGGVAYWLLRQRWPTDSVQAADDWARMWGFDI